MNKMKTLHIILDLLGALVLLVGCDKMNDIQEKFASQEEQVYLGKVDSLKSYPGFGRAKITWYIGSDPKIENTIVYWNMRKDSLVIPFHRKTPGIQKDSLIVENLSEGSFLFEFRNTNSRGESSLFSLLTVSTWGGNFASGLQGRRLLFKEFGYEQSTFKLSFSPCAGGDHVFCSEVVYKDVNGKERILRIPRGTDELVLQDFPDGETVKYRTVFFLTEGIDTVYNDYQSVTAPKVIKEKGTKIAVGDGPDSRYFECDGTLCEWNQAGDMVMYEPDGNGSFARSRVLQGIAPRTDFREFFFYDDDRYITVAKSNNAVDMYSLDLEAENPALAVVKKGFGSGFSFPNFIPACGFFYSLENNGKLRAWYAYNNGTWDSSSNGATIATDFKYTRYALFKYASLIVIDEDGYLWDIPITTTGHFVTRNKIGQGWSNFQRLVTAGDKLLAMDGNGDFWKFDFDVDHYWIVD